MARKKTSEMNNPGDPPPAETPPEPEVTTSGDKPIHTIQIGRLRVSIWSNEGEHGAYYTAKLRRSYQDGEGWKHSNSLGRDDLPLAAKMLDMAHTWICQATGEIPF